MSGFSSLPLELRSLVLEAYLKDTLAAYRVEGTALWESYDKTFPLHPTMDFYSPEWERGVTSRREISREIISLLYGAAMVVRNRIHAFLAEDRLELERSLKIQLKNLLGEGKILCGKIVALQSEGSETRDSERDRIKEEWLKYETEIEVLQWLCNIIQMAMDVDEDRWWTFNFHRAGCRWDGTGCRCAVWTYGPPGYQIRP